MNDLAKPVADKDGTSSATDRQPLIAETLAGFAAGLEAESIPSEVIERAKIHILDTLGIGLASTTYEFGQRTANAMRGLGGDGDSPVIGMPMRLPVRDAVLTNGVLVHGLDFDDTHGGAVIHTSASAVPVMLGAGLQAGVSGLEAIAAYLVSVEACARIGASVKGGFHRSGHHPTGLVGTFGCTLAVGRMMDLSVKQLHSAQGIALSMGCGSQEFLADGAWTKRMHPGWSGVSAITAAALAKQGFFGPTRPYEGNHGLFNLHLKPTESADLAVCTAGLGEEWELMNVAFKPYPACHFNHATADCAQALRDQGLTADNVESITAYMHETPADVVCEPLAAKRRPANSYEAQFSIPYIVAATLVRGRFTLDELEPDAFTDPEILAVCDRVSWEKDTESLFPRYYSGALRAKTKDGKELFHREAKNRGSDGNPLAEDDLVAKFWANATRAVSARRAQRVLDAVMDLDVATDLWELDEALCLD